MATKERLEQLKRSLQQVGSALQEANLQDLRPLETAAGAPTPPATTTPSASIVDMRVLGKPSIFAGDEASWKSWSFVMLSFSAAVSPELRALMEKARTYGRRHEEREPHCSPSRCGADSCFTCSV